MDERQRADLIEKVESCRGKRGAILAALGIPRATYYKWRRQYMAYGVEGLRLSPVSIRRIWNRLVPDEREHALTVARSNPELSARLLAVKITDEGQFSVSESSVFRIDLSPEKRSNFYVRMLA